MVNEGGSVEIDGNGVLMACKSSILNSNRNPGMSQQQAEEIFTKNLGVTKFIWLEGKLALILPTCILMDLPDLPIRLLLLQ